MIRLVMIALILSTASAMAQTAQPDIDYLNKAIVALQAQRNQAFDAHAVSEAKLAQSQEQLKQAQLKIKELEDKLKEKDAPKEGPKTGE